jgi:16S rRNA (cytosine967-C5)-methyltransferase
LLDALAGSVRPGGLLCFSTCSLEPEENELQIEAFLQSQPTFRRDPSPRVPSELLTPAGDLALLPQRHGTDGAFAARLRRVA